MTTDAPQPPPAPPPPPHTAAEKAQRSRMIVANTRRASITFWVATVTSPMWLTLAGTFLAGMLTSLLLTRTRTRKRDKQAQ
jgi:hypothetical protein